jgi:hypothetical protein
MSFPEVLPPEEGLSVTAVTVTPDLIGIAVSPDGRFGGVSVVQDVVLIVHSRYVLTVADLLCQGRRVVFMRNRAAISVPERRV